MPGPSSLAAAQPHVLREYALLADGERGALIGPRGDVAWLCFPGWADQAVLAALLGGRGTYTVQPRGRFVWGGAYEPGTLIWRGRWITEDGIVECREALAFPGEPGRAVLLRRIEAVEGVASMTVACAPAADYGRQAARGLRQDDDGAWHGRLEDARFRWDGAAGARRIDGVLCLELDLEPGTHHDLTLVLSTGDPGPAPDPGVSWQATESAWAERMPELSGTIAPRDARHACAVLRGLTSAGGGMVAAATMGLPERADEGRSFDYRYAWIRDQALAGQAAARAGADELLDAAVRFIRARLLDDGPELTPAYTVGGGRVPDQQRLGLPGYPGEAGGRGAAWLALADDLLAEASATALHASGRWRRAPDDDRLDAALLLPPLRGTPAPDDPRSIATLRAIEDGLAEGHYLYRFRPDARPLGEAEGAFLLCGFAMALALHQQGRDVDAARWFERNRSACGTPGLLSEELDVRQRQLRGNLPQAFVHALLLEAAAALAG